MERSPTFSPGGRTSAASRLTLRGLLEVTARVRAGGDLLHLLTAIARTIARSLGYESVVVSLYRPAWDDFEVATVHGREETCRQLLGRTQSVGEWERPLDDSVNRRGAYDRGAGADAWHPEDALFVPLRHTDAHLLGVLSVGEPLSRRRPTDDDLDALVAVADHAALAVQSAQEAAVAARHKLALERLLAVSSRLPAEPVADEILDAVGPGVRDALGFRDVLAVLRDTEGVLEPRAAVGWTLDDVRRTTPGTRRRSSGSPMRRSTRRNAVAPGSSSSRSPAG